MEHPLLLLMQTAGVDTKNSLARFAGRENLYVKFLLRFPQDDTFRHIQTALASENWLDMLQAAHTLKGVSANLGMTRLFEACSQTVSLLRQPDTAAAKDSFAELEAAYCEMNSLLHQWEAEH